MTTENKANILNLGERALNVLTYAAGALLVALVVGYAKLYIQVQNLPTHEDMRSKPDKELILSWFDNRDQVIQNIRQYSQDNRGLIIRLRVRFNNYTGHRERASDAVWHLEKMKPYEVPYKPPKFSPLYKSYVARIDYGSK